MKLQPLKTQMSLLQWVNGRTLAYQSHEDDECNIDLFFRSRTMNAKERKKAKRKEARERNRQTEAASAAVMEHIKNKSTTKTAAAAATTPQQKVIAAVLRAIGPFEVTLNQSDVGFLS